MMLSEKPTLFIWDIEISGSIAAAWMDALIINIAFFRHDAFRKTNIIHLGKCKFLFGFIILCVDINQIVL